MFSSGMDARRSRSHGDIFPLPLDSLKEFVQQEGVPRPQRAFWIGQTLNKLVLQGLENSHSSVLSSSLPLTATQTCAASRIAQSLKLHGDCPEGLCVESSLQLMRCSLSPYDGIPSNLAPYEPGKLKILEKGTCPQHMFSSFLLKLQQLSKIFEPPSSKTQPRRLDHFPPTGILVFGTTGR